MWLAIRSDKGFKKDYTHNFKVTQQTPSISEKWGGKRFLIQSHLGFWKTQFGTFHFG